MNQLKYKCLITHGVNKKGVDYFVGDIQGHHSLLIKQLDELEFDYSNDRLYCAGDLVDKGPESEDCINLLKSPWFYSVLGNHDLMFIESANNITLKKEYLSSYGGWAASLFDDSLKYSDMSYLMKLKMPLCRVIHTAHGSVGIAHAGFPSDLSVIASTYYQGPTELLFTATSSRALFHDPLAKFDNIDKVFLGHNSVDEVLCTNNIVWLDTIHTGRLSIVKLSDVENIKSKSEEVL